MLLFKACLTAIGASCVHEGGVGANGREGGRAGRGEGRRGEGGSGQRGWGVGGGGGS